MVSRRQESRQEMIWLVKQKKTLVERKKLRLCTSPGLYLGGDAPSESASSAGL